MLRRTLLLLLLTATLSAAAQWPLSPRWETPEREVRAVWLTTLMGLDWPRTTDMAAQQAALTAMLDDLQAAGINTVLFQTRVRGTTAYPSAIEPWDGAFTGKAGCAPDYDVLRFAIDACHQRGMEFHAWVVCYPVCKVTVAKALGKESIVRRHPEMVQRCGDQWMLDPGVPGVADYLASLCREIVTLYDVDGLHLDYIRYPEHGIAFDDAKTYRRYGQGVPKAQWRRDNVSRTVEAIARQVRAVRPWVKISCSPVGKYADLPRQSSRGWNARDAVAQDAMLWLQRGWMDMLMPMMYFDGDHFYPFLVDWMERAAEVAGGRLIVPGLGIYLLSPREKDWPLTAITRQLHTLRGLGAGGAAYFRTRFLTDDQKGLLSFLRHDYYLRPALPPAMTWLDDTPPAQPRYTATRQGDTPSLPPLLRGAITLHFAWENIVEPTPITYNIYRLDGTERVLIAHHLQGTSYDYTPPLPSLLDAKYEVVAMDAYGNESRSGTL